MTPRAAIETHNLTKIFRSKVRSLEPRGFIFKRKEYKTVTAVDHLNLEIKRGELIWFSQASQAIAEDRYA